MIDEIDDEYLHICGTCFRLYETGRSDDEEQRCDCNQEEEERWSVGDFNERACLCGCCGMEILPSGSRWSQFYCRECQLLAMGVSLWERRLVFPIGRHSLMHAWVPQDRNPLRAARASSGDRALETVHDTIKVIVASSDAQSQWSANIVSRHLKRLRLPGGTPVSSYLAALEKDEEVPTRWALFAEFCEFIRTPSR